MNEIQLDKKKKSPEERVRARNEARILDAAVGLFAQKGFDGTSITEIAEVSGLPKANIYYYFSTKEAIYTRLIEEVLAGWDEALESISADRDPREAISDYVRAKLEYSRRNGIQSRFFAHEIMRGGHFFSKKQKVHMRNVTRDYVKVLNQWIAEGKIVDMDPNHFFIMLWGATEYYADFYALATLTLERRKLTKADFDRAHATITKTILDGCLK